MKIPLRHDFPLELRPVEEKDADTVFRLVDDNRRHLRQWLPWLDSNTDIEDTYAFIRAAQEQHFNNRGFQAGIWYELDLAGFIGFHPIDWQNRIVLIGYWLGEKFQGKGIMTTACQAMVDFGFREYGMNRIEIRCATGNKKSCAIPQRLGFTMEGVIKDGEWLYDHFVDLIVYRMLAKEWEKL
ncbi:MAG TPA: GNAT family protein [Bacteroidota bacterium]|nr:GNAT family protein [Bacteroidota bacterium]